VSLTPEVRAELRTVQVMVAEVLHRLGRGHPDYGVLLEAVRRLNRITAVRRLKEGVGSDGE
jgi:hypothetical protein